jgi:hypothetical protein
MMDKKYSVIVKTGGSELKAMENLSKEVVKKILPVVELTRGRAKNTGTKEDPKFIYPYDSKLRRVKDIFEDVQIALDVTSDEGLSSNEIDDLFESSNGYAKWISLLNELRNSLNLIPSILRNYNDENFEENFRGQVASLSENFSEIMYRCALDDEGAVDDMQLICECLDERCNLLIILDCGWVAPASYKDPANVCIDRIQQLKEILEDRQYSIVVCSTTFPNNVSEIGDDRSDTFDLREIDLYKLVAEKYPEVIYGDYGSINPVRNDQIVMARGWIPRIDVPLKDKIYYYRERKGSRAYSDTYTSVAKKAVSDVRFPSSVEAWGISQIQKCALGDAPSASPSFWISVRMGTHIIQQINRLGL